MIYLGIDPGKDGAMAIIRENGIQIIPFDELDYADAVNGLRDFRLSFNIARAVDLNQLDRSFAATLYKLYLRLPEKQRDAGASVFARNRIRTIGR